MVQIRDTLQTKVKTKKGAILPARFDIALINVDADPGVGVTGNLIIFQNISFSYLP